MYRLYTNVVKTILHVRRKDVKNQIYELRTGNNISQGALADKCKVSRQTINAIENNKYDPSLALAFRLAEVLGTTVDKLFLYKM
ncbi:helix-turn-helix transcriptional regulator [Bacillus tropicus]|uniref:helix-turn-helix transcriptional regulator n=1 Tax=Bacillus tropicus TaxID=2026188 RepID=UPI000A05AC88|nr:helix-turn-helix transcriptional regulator [Bacillus tropicus]MDF9556647.1 helix-turn-helix transcriptional regulator [Bacillus tropicus]MDF9591502.1 helix-turn-helix transcriptional regulator [Bacillus tropicus]MDF9649136.1 helix-turn-helix transcriptional regulator [Bacillus tropicus]HDR7799360.1 helix-turn-helix transcriptional regulator [Bacillus tropicus]